MDTSSLCRSVGRVFPAPLGASSSSSTRRGRGRGEDNDRGDDPVLISCLDARFFASNLRNDTKGGNAVVRAIIDEMGEQSAEAQGLRAPITSYSKLSVEWSARGSAVRTPSPSRRRGGRGAAGADRLDGRLAAQSVRDQRQRLYLAHDGEAAVYGLLKVGPKDLFIMGAGGGVAEIRPLCVLDFYVHRSFQRRGIGLSLFRAMLKHERTSAARLGYDRPSSKFIGFLAKHYRLVSYTPQANNFVVFHDYWRTASPELEAEEEADVAAVDDLGDEPDEECPPEETAAPSARGQWLKPRRDLRSVASDASAGGVASGDNGEANTGLTPTASEAACGSGRPDRRNAIEVERETTSLSSSAYGGFSTPGRPQQPDGDVGSRSRGYQSSRSFASSQPLPRRSPHRHAYAAHMESPGVSAILSPGLTADRGDGDGTRNRRGRTRNYR